MAKRFAKRTARWAGLLGGLVCAAAASGQSRTVSAGSPLVVGETMHLRDLTIEPDGSVQASPGHSVTLTVDGVERDLVPGSYHGAIVLTETDAIPVKHQGAGDPYPFRAAVYVNDGQYVPASSVSAAAGGDVSGTEAKNLTIRSEGERFNGVFVTGDSSYKVVNATIDMNGNGRDDFAGYGAAIAASGNAKLTVEGAHIRTHGAVRTAIFVGGNSTVTVNHADIDTASGTLPRGYKFTISPGEMMEVPYGLGISGNVRATNLIDTGTVYYNDSHIRAHGWGALSSDGDGPTHMYVTNSVVETIGSGYGAYANGDSHDVFKHCTFNTADYALVIGGNGSGTFTDGTTVNSARIGIMMHQGSGGGTLLIDKGSVVHAHSAAVEVKGRGTDIVIDGAQLHADNGVLIQTMNNDDPIMKAMMSGPPPAASGPGSGGPGAAAPAPPSDIPGGGGRPTFSGDVKVEIRDTTLEGDIVHAMKNTGEMSVKLQHATLRGAISLGESHPTSGAEPTRETFRTIGEVTNTLAPDSGKFGLHLVLGEGANWVVTKKSFLSTLTISSGASIKSPTSTPATLLINGVNTPLAPGDYKGDIVVQ